MENTATRFLVKELRKGNITALEKIYKIYYSRIYGFCKKFGLSTLEPDDFVQETFLKLWENREQLKEDVLLDKQIFIICRNLIINHLKREAKTVSEIEDVSPADVFEFPHVEENKKRSEILHWIIQKLPNKRKKIFELHKIENLTYEEIAGFLNISKKTIAHQIYLANNFIKEELQNSNFNK